MSKKMHLSTAMLKRLSSFPRDSRSYFGSIYVMYKGMHYVFTQVNYLLFFTTIPSLLHATLNIGDWETSNCISKLSCQVASC